MASQDAAIFLRDSEERFLAKVKSVVMVGGVGGIARGSFRHAMHRSSTRRRKPSIPFFSSVETEPPLEPDNSEVNQSISICCRRRLSQSSLLQVNQFDMNAANFFMERCQKLGIELVMVPKEVRGSS